MTHLTVVVPVYNEAGNVRALYHEIKSVLEPLPESAEIIIVDDGSTDSTFAVLRELHEKDSGVRVIRLARNTGQTAALAAGLSHARGAIIVTLDGDLQNDPADIPKLLATLEDGYDLVNGWRQERHEPFWMRRLPSRIANWLIARTTGVELHDYGCSLKAYRGSLAKSLHLHGEMHRFIPALAADLGARITEVPVRDRPRLHGRSKYGLSRTVRVILDLITVRFLSSYSTRPIHVFGPVGILSSVLGGGILAYLTLSKILFNANIADRPLLLLGILLVLVGIQFISMGLLAEMVARTYHEAQGKPVYVVRELLDASPAPSEESSEVQRSSR